MQLPCKPRTLTTILPKVTHPSTFRGGYGIKLRKGLPQGWVPTPLVLPELQPVSKPNCKPSSCFEHLLSASDSLPHPHTMSFPNSFRTTTPLNLPILAHNHPLYYGKCHINTWYSCWGFALDSTSANFFIIYFYFEFYSENAIVDMGYVFDFLML